MLGIGRKDKPIKNQVYQNKNESGWVWAEDMEINEFLEKYKDRLNQDVDMPDGYIEDDVTEEDLDIKTYTITYDANGGEGAPSNQTKTHGTALTLSSKKPTRTGYTFIGWATSSSAIVAEYVSGASYTIEATTTLYAVWQQSSQVLASVANVGDYVTYVPSSTSYSIGKDYTGYSEQTFNPSSTTSWRVFSNDGSVVTIISTESIGEFYLSGKTGYANGVDALNTLCSAYVNTTYATSGRSVGCTSSSTARISESSIVHGVSGEPFTDTYHTTDANIIEAGNLYHTQGSVWMASRYSDTFTKSTYSYTKFGLRFLQTEAYSGTVYGSLYGIENGVESSIDNGPGVRPIITLKTGVKASGSGTVDDPYVLQ